MTYSIKKSLKLIIIAFVMIISLFGLSITACAAETYQGTIITSTSYKTIAYSTNGFNRNVKVFNASTSTDGLGILRADIRMLDRYGNIVWEEKKACPGYGSRVFWCGSNVYKIQIKVAYGKGTARATPA